MLSRVVPGMLLTMTRSSPVTRLTRLLFPALGLPMTATRMPSSWVSPSQASWGRRSKQASSRSPVPLPWRAEMPTGSPRPRL